MLKLYLTTKFIKKLQIFLQILPPTSGFSGKKIVPEMRFLNEKVSGPWSAGGGGGGRGEMEDGWW